MKVFPSYQRNTSFLFVLQSQPFHQVWSVTLTTPYQSGLQIAFFFLLGMAVGAWKKNAKTLVKAVTSLKTKKNRLKKLTEISE